MSALTHLLHESSLGYSIFQVVNQPDVVGNRLQEVQKTVQDLGLFGKLVRLVSFAPFQGAVQAFEEINLVSDGVLSDFLRNVLDTNLPKPDKKHEVVIGVAERSLAGSIKEAFPGVKCETGEIVADLLRGCRMHQQKLLKNIQHGDIEMSQRGLGHSYSRGRVKLNPGRNDNHIKEAIAILDHLDKAVNSFAMRIKEWYGWHFPELIRIVSDYQTYAKVCLFIGDKKTLSDDRLHDLAAELNDDAGLAQSVIDAAKVSMGQDISEADMEQVRLFATRAVSLGQYRKSLAAYLIAKMNLVAPNLAALIGETVGARLISQAGSLTNLAKCPASTVQILGAEKALFRALKTKGNTPKYGLIYHSSFIGKAGLKNKGRISRFLANKCSIASRIDNFSEMPSTTFGDALKRQVEERLDFYANGAVPTKNSIAMQSAMDSVLADINVDSSATVVPPVDTAMNDILPASNEAAEGEGEAARKLSKEEKKLMKQERKKQKRKHTDVDGDLHMEGAEPEGEKQILDADLDGEKKKKKKKKHREAKV
ncbi:MAG: snoRNP complex protein nop56 [Chrysothrix sp. TS-e1954]|nr:MAG: snoRNP complex protein nop56 [Chrysothrix sp. TS-e1954]